MKTKHILVEMKIQCGEYEYNSKSVHEISKRKSITKFAEDYAKDFYATKDYSQGDIHFFNGGEVAVRAGVSQEITQEEYNILNKFL